MFLTSKRHILRGLVLSAALASLTTSCFTGVESTPKISSADVRKENIIVRPEQKFLGDIIPTPPALWQKGKEFYVTENKINLALSEASTADKNRLAGKTINFEEFRPAVSLSGDTVAEIVFRAPDGLLFFRSDIPYSSLQSRQSMEVPFTIERSIIDQARERMAGKRFYITTPLWYNVSGLYSVSGLRHVPVDIVDVLPGNSVYPLRVVFRQEGSQTDNSVFMTVGNSRSATRNFENLFAFDNPRTKYPRITDETWNLIIHSDVRNGMTRDECRLALGAPTTIGQHPLRGIMAEYWQYTDGVYLVFEDGYLVSYRK